MTPFLSNSQQNNNGGRFEDRMVNVTVNFCSIVSMPVELALRPFHGTTYFSPLVLVCSGGMMLILPMIFSVAGTAYGLVAAGNNPPPGIFGMWDLSKLFFLGCAVHGFRKWLLMIHPEREKFSSFEGPPLFFFNWLPGGFWRVRSIYEPLFLIVLSTVLKNFFIIEPGAASFLVISAFALAMKSYARWYLAWQYIRGVLDARNMGPIIAALADNRATENELAQIHLAAFPKDISDDLRREAAEAIGRHLAH